MQDGKAVILCVDDDPDVLESLQIILEASDFVVFTASTAEEGVDQYKKANPDFMVVDLMMEEVDSGANFAREMKLLNNQAPVLLLSSVGDSMATNADYNDIGFAGVFQKPINPELLVRTIKSKLGIA